MEVATALNNVDRVLELGGNIGRMSMVLATHLDDNTKHLVTLEPNNVSRERLVARASAYNSNMKVLGYAFNDDPTTTVDIKQTHHYYISSMTDTPSSPGGPINKTFR